MKKRHKQSFKLAFLVLWPLVIFGVGLQMCRSPRGFNLQKIRSDFVFKEGMNQRAQPAEDFKKLQDVFSQKFTYLDRGGQCYAFVSEDQKYVIKFFRMKNLTPKYWLNYIPLPWLEKYRFEKIQMRERQRLETFDSFKAAFEEFKEETGLLFVHFHKTHYLHDKVTFIDKTGKEHVIALNTVPFVLQKRAQMIYPYVSELIKDGENQKALDSLTSVLYLIKDRCQKGYVDKDGGVSSNYGFVEGKAVEIDLGRVVKDESIKDPMNYLREILRVSKKIEIWLQGSYPDLCPLFQEEVQKILSNEDVSLI